jgi:acetyl/propionyl-CoA carboxylase alpha subunit
VKKGVYLIGAVVLGTIALTWLVWHQTWFGTRLDDDELIASMAPSATARQTQHGIEEITHRLGRPGADRWAKVLVEASRRAEDPVRVSAAWAMQYDAGREEFVVRLREMVASDASVLVRRNAATSLASAGDASGRAVLRSMLEPFTVAAADAGVVADLLAVDTPVAEGGTVAIVKKDDGTQSSATAPVPGRVLRRAAVDGARVAAGEALVVLGPDDRHASNAAFGLALVGTKDDLEALGLAAAPQSAFGDEVKAAARQAADAIRARGK